MSLGKINSAPPNRPTSAGLKRHFEAGEKEGKRKEGRGKRKKMDGKDGEGENTVPK